MLKAKKALAVLQKVPLKLFSESRRGLTTVGGQEHLRPTDGAGVHTQASSVRVQAAENHKGFLHFEFLLLTSSSSACVSVLGVDGDDLPTPSTDQKNPVQAFHQDLQELHV